MNKLVSSVDAPRSARGAIIQLHELTAARGFAALLVVLYHISAYSNGALAAWFPPIAYGPLAVDFFFVLSGFVLTHVYRAPWKSGVYDHRGFILRRFARVWPLHIATLLGVAVLVMGGARFGIQPPWEPTLGSFLVNALMLHATGLAPELAWNQPSWSISAEWCAYLAFPFFLIVADALRSNAARAVAALALFSVFYGLSYGITGENLMVLTTLGVLRIIPSFFAGVVLRYVFDDIAKHPLASNTRALSSLMWGVVILAFVGAFAGAPNAFFWLLIVASILLLALRGANPNAGIMRSRPLIWLGDISYALYLVHAPVLMVAYGIGGKLVSVTSTGGLLAIGALALLASILIAHLAHMLIERPAQRAITSYGRKHLPAAA